MANAPLKVEVNIGFILESYRKNRQKYIQRILDDAGLTPSEEFMVTAEQVAEFAYDAQISLLEALKEAHNG